MSRKLHHDYATTFAEDVPEVEPGFGIEARLIPSNIRNDLNPKLSNNGQAAETIPLFYWGTILLLYWVLTILEGRIVSNRNILSLITERVWPVALSYSSSILLLR